MICRHWAVFQHCGITRATLILIKLQYLLSYRDTDKHHRAQFYQYFLNMLNRYI